ncbi:hypothetical protein B6J19_05080 [Klebsiella quasipneumoniae]|nr:hypothetical protein A9493_12330 [Klebsiella pneumoniae]OUY33266.1 hypothetical protein BLK92_29895 [Klebsiella pneumoniae]OZZ64838.1 hypothetical protein CDA25_04205 [Klebsiella pneumoniae]PLG93169.1 hypothetical protein B6J19_05080 [Klebsiella quasipneumoniae]
MIAVIVIQIATANAAKGFWCSVEGIAGWWRLGEFQAIKNPAGARSERQGEIRYAWKAYTAGL